MPLSIFPFRFSILQCAFRFSMGVHSKNEKDSFQNLSMSAQTLTLGNEI